MDAFVSVKKKKYYVAYFSFLTSHHAVAYTPDRRLYSQQRRTSGGLAPAERRPPSRTRSGAAVSGEDGRAQTYQRRAR